MPNRRVSSSVSLPPFQRLIDDHAHDIHGFLVATVGRRDADDCYQETWLAALRAYPRLRSAANLRSWLMTIAYRKAIDQLRSRRRAGTLTDEPPEPRDSSPSSSSDDAIWVHVRALPPKQRTAVALRYLADAPYAEISAAMGTSEEAARRNVHEALKRLRMEYQR